MVNFKISLYLLFFVPLWATPPQEINQLFREYYKQAQEKSLATRGPIFIVNGDKLVLHYKGQRQEVNYLPPLYHRLKEIAHIPLALEIGLEYGQELAFFEHWIVHMQDQLVQFPPHLRDNQQAILDITLNFLEEKPNLVAFCRAVAPYLLKNAEEAAFIQLDALHEQTQLWKKTIPQEDWDRLAAIVIGPQMPRVGEVTLQYFARLTGKSLSNSQVLPTWLTLGEAEVETLNPSKQNRRLVYAENLWNEEDALKLLATHIIDEKIGYLFFDDNQRMQCDLLAEAASRRLKEKCEHKESACAVKE